MKPTSGNLCALGLVTVLGVGAAVAAPGESPGFWTNPVISPAGKIHALPKAAYRPDPGETHRIVFSVTKEAEGPTKVNPGLERVARTVNLYASAGVALDHLHFVAVLYGPATPAALADAQYRARFGVDNPNLEVVRQLRKAGVDVSVCGQAVAEKEFSYNWITPEFTLSLSALTTIATLESKGYALVPL